MDNTRGSQLGFSEFPDPDWDSFEEVEAYARDETGVLEMLLPRSIWEYFFAPTEADQSVLSQYRGQIVEQCDSALNVYYDAQVQLFWKSDLQGLEDSNSLNEVVDEHEQSQYPASVESRENYGSPREFINEIEQALEREHTAVEVTDRLLSKPEAAFLREGERAELAKAKEFLAYSVEQGTERKTEIEDRWEEIREALDGRIEPWEREVNELRERSRPYLEGEEYLAEDEVLNAAESLHDEIVSVDESLPIETVSHPLVTRLHDLERRTAQLIKRLERSRVKYAKTQYERFTLATQEVVESIQQQLKPARETGEKIRSPDEVMTEITEARSDIEEFRNTAFSSQISDNKMEALSRYEGQLDEFQEFIQEKLRFDSRIDEHSRTVQQLHADAKPYLDYDRYLTRPASSDLADRIESIQADLDRVAAETRFQILSENDWQRCEQLKERIETIDARLSEYNSEFVRRQRNDCVSLFQNIGASGVDLTKEQEHAVIRNGIYNQVVAAAGTGKTLTLTTRVAYLIREQGIDPDRILVVTYTNEATEEMRTRLKEQFGITGVEIRTVHSFGREIIQDAQEAFVESIGQHQKENFIDRQIREARKAGDSEFLDHYYEFLVHFTDVYYEEEDFETKKEYVQARAGQEYTTLQGEEVKSRAEKLIADFLFTHQVDYRYEDLATWADTAVDKGEYAPDFYLPEYDVYIEHWGIDESGSIAPWFSWSSEDYRAKMTWARGEFEKSECTLVGTYEFEHEADRLKQALRHRLSAHGVALERMEFEELVETAFDYEQREGWIKRQFRAFIENAKRFDVQPDDIEANLSEEKPRQYHFSQCGIHLLQQYLLYLTRNGLIDFTDMIHDAVDLIREQPGEYKDRYDHLLVDEFQDIGKGKLELIQELTGPDAAKLFAVGDDWQSIFSFQGAVIEFFTDFETHFGEPVRTELTANFRSPPRIVTAGNDLIGNNQNQLAKIVTSTKDQDTDPRVHALQGYNFYDYVRRVQRYTVDLIQQYQRQGASPSEIMVLCRFDDAVPYLEEIKKGLKSQGIPFVGKSAQYRGPDGKTDEGVAVYSLYQAKGREAKHVIVVHAAEGPYGFPPANRENELMEPVQPIPLGGIEEERRAFYVAITRSEHTLDLLTRVEQESQFLDEISEYTEPVEAGKVEPLDEVGEYMTVTVKVDQLRDPWNKQQQRGFLADRYGGSARFVSWENNDPPTLEEGEWYTLSGVRVGKYKDEKELVLTQQCSVTHLSDRPGRYDTSELQ